MSRKPENCIKYVKNDVGKIVAQNWAILSNTTKVGINPEKDWLPDHINER